MADQGILTPGQQIKPKLDEKKAIELVTRLYGFKVKEISELNAYDDKNYHVVCEDSYENHHVAKLHEHGYVLKIINSLDSRNIGFIEAQNEMMLFLRQREIRCTVPVKNLQGSFSAVENIPTGSNVGYVVRLLEYQPGSTLRSVPITKTLLRDVGQFVARLGATLSNFSHPAIEKRSFLWMLAAVPKLRDYMYALNNEEDRKMIAEVVKQFETQVFPVVEKLEHGIIHGDLNEQNLLVNAEGTRVIAVIDFGDSHRACTVFDLAIAACYMIIQTRDMFAAKYVIEGFQSVKKLINIEKSIMKICVCARLSQSLTLGAYSYMQDPQNEYLLVTQKPGWEMVKKLWPMSDEDVMKIWGLENS
ncbi:hydroxylysine kinase [Venturia canescens]|uniref:hydroxylysine kinase n=1 Tax=Venturia canescens TaxID=32260 RepID=UPI001C9BC0C4|nr:hydroxylysine kinase [Venturia canescens]XP_043281705.1 hydroxylysine kinase [Venturia canescens]